MGRQNGSACVRGWMGVARIKNFLEMKLRNSPFAARASCGAIELLSVYDIGCEKV